MGLYDDIQADVTAAFDSDLADAVTTVQFEIKGEPHGFDPSNGSYVDNVSLENSRGVFYDESVSSTGIGTESDMKLFLVLDVDMPAGVEINDKVITATSKEYTIYSIDQDPTGSVHIMKVKSNG